MRTRRLPGKILLPPCFATDVESMVAHFLVKAPSVARLSKSVASGPTSVPTSSEHPDQDWDADALPTSTRAGLGCGRTSQ